MIAPGLFLKSTSALRGTVFEDTVIVIVQEDPKGSIGFIINQRTSRFLNELEEFRHCKSFTLYLGGPVDQEHIYLVHTRPDLIGGAIKVNNNLYWAGDMNDVVSNIQNRSLNEDQLKIMLGYCGWDAGELQLEIEEGSWLIINEVGVFQ